jgi:thymidine kinase
MCYGLRVDFQGKLFPGSATLLALADEMREVRTICHCGKKATMVIRQDADGHAITDGAQVQIGGNNQTVKSRHRDAQAFQRFRLLLAEVSTLVVALSKAI